MLSACYSSTATALIMDSCAKPSPIEQFLHQLSGQEKDPDLVSIDHNYCKPWNAHPDSNRAKPARMLFMKGLSRHSQSSPISNPDEEIDVETVSEAVVPPYDNIKTRQQVDECERYVKASLVDGSVEDKEEHVKKIGWSPMQKRLFTQVMKVLQADRLAQLVISGTVNEPLKRRISLDKTARRLRHIFSSYYWDLRLLRWLHLHLLDSLTTSMLAAYFDVLRTLRVKTPHIVDKILSVSSTLSVRFGSSGNSTIEGLTQLCRKPWDPVLPLLNQHRSKKLPGNPLIFVVPSGPNHTAICQSRRMRFWYNHLGTMGKVVHASMPSMTSSCESEIDAFLDQIVLGMRKKIVEMKNQFPDRPIILLGWTIGALMAVHIASEESVNAVVCLGFPLTGVNGSRGDLDDPLLESRVPTLFVIGQNASTCSVDDIEDFRERMKAETGLVVVGGADDMLRVSHNKKKIESITQAMVDRCLMDEVGDFIASVISQQVATLYSHPAPSKQRVYSHSGVLQRQAQPSPENEVKRRRRKPREYSPELSPARKRPRQHTPKQIYPAQGPKALSSSSSEASSTGSCASEQKRALAEANKKSPMRKVGRPTSSIVRKQPVKEVEKTIKIASSSEAPLKENSSQAADSGASKKCTLKETTAAVQEPHTEEPSVSKTSTVTNTKVNNAILATANQQKNAPVDVEKAFGRDSSFLPRPLTPAEPDQSLCLQNKSPVELPAKTNAEEPSCDQAYLVSGANDNVVQLNPSKSTVLGLSSSTLTGFLNSVSNKQMTTVGSFPATFSTQVCSTVAIQKPQVVSQISDPLSQSNSEGLQMMQKIQPQDFPLPVSCIIGANKDVIIAQPSLISSSSSSAGTISSFNLKSVQSIPSPVISKSILAANVSSVKPQTVLVATPSSTDTAAILVTNSNVISSPAKQIQLHRMIVKSSLGIPNKFPLPLLKPLPASNVSFVESLPKESNKSAEPQVCNLSLLSDVAGMKERLKGMQECKESVSSTSTRVSSFNQSSVALGTSKPVSFGTVKKINIAETSRLPKQMISPPVRQETAEELAEKQMAIQVLSSSFDSEGSTSSIYPKKDTSYSICYKKADGSVVSRTISKLGYSLVMPTAKGSRAESPRQVMPRRGRGRGGSAFSVRKPISQPRYPF